MGRSGSGIGMRIVHAARRRFLLEGVDGASLRAIARDAKTSIGMIYYYYPAKDDLFLAVVEEIYLALLKDLESRLDRSRPVAERIRLLYERLGALSDDEKQVLRLVIREALASPDRLESLIERFQRGHLPLVLQLVNDGTTEGVFRKDLPSGLVLGALMAIGGPAQIVLGVAERHLPRRAVPPGPDRAQALVDILLTGIAPGVARRR
jgi:AcrR family transcriptional regulator